MKIIFNKILKPNRFYTEDIDAYSLSNKSKLIVNTYSTIGLLIPGMKVLFLDPFYFVQNSVINMFVDELEGPMVLWK